MFILTFLSLMHVSFHHSISSAAVLRSMFPGSIFLHLWFPQRSDAGGECQQTKKGETPIYDVYRWNAVPLNSNTDHKLWKRHNRFISRNVFSFNLNNSGFRDVAQANNQNVALVLFKMKWDEGGKAPDAGEGRAGAGLMEIFTFKMRQSFGDWFVFRNKSNVIHTEFGLWSALKWAGCFLRWMRVHLHGPQCSPLVFIIRIYFLSARMSRTFACVCGRICVSGQSSLWSSAVFGHFTYPACTWSASIIYRRRRVEPKGQTGQEGQ